MARLRLARARACALAAYAPIRLMTPLDILEILLDHPSGPLFYLGLRWWGRIPVTGLALPSAETGLKIHFSASSHLEGNALPFPKGKYLLVLFACKGTRSELQPFWYVEQLAAVAAAL
jgi:hypothetical protein